MSIEKNGIITSPNIYESKAMNLHYYNNPGDRDSHTYSFTPANEDNSCMRDIIVHGELYPQNEVMHVRFKVSWNGFDASSTNGTFSMYFQGYYKDGSTTNWGTPIGNKASNVKDLKDLVLSSITGEYIYDFTYYNVPYTTHEGYRANYSNGIGTISFSDFIVIPEKYYIPENSGGGYSYLHLGKDYISSGEIIEI